MTWMSSLLTGMDASPEELLADWAAMRLTIFENASHQGRGGCLPRMCSECSSLSTVIKSTKLFDMRVHTFPMSRHSIRNAQAKALGRNLSLACWSLMSLPAIQSELSVEACHRCVFWIVGSQLDPMICGALSP